MGLTLKNLKFCYDTLKGSYKSMSIYNMGKHFGYLEAGLLQFGYLEVVKINGIQEVKKNIIKSDKWWKKDKSESYESAILRMVEKLFTDNNIEFDKPKN
jgi:hypothetical protein